MDQIRDVLKKQPKPNFTLQTVIKAISRAIDAEDILVDCTCPDFRYRFAYWATKYGYKWGKPENRPSNITNPKDKLGAMCKHLTSLLANKKWLVKVASIINEFAKAYPDDFLDYLDVKDAEIKTPGKRRHDRTLKKTNILPKENPEELEPLDSDEDSDEVTANGRSSDEELEVADEEDGFDADEVEINDEGADEDD